MEPVLCERDVFQVRLDLTPSQILGVRSSLTLGRERLERHIGLWTASHLSLDSLPASSVSGFVDRVARLLGDEVSAHRAGLTDVAALVSDSLEMDSPPILELLLTDERKD